MQNSHIPPLHRLIKNLTSNWLVLFVEVGLAFYLTPYIVNELGLTNYGIWSLLNGLVGYLGLVDMGIRGGAGRYINIYLAKNESKKVSQVISTSIAVLSILAVVVLVLAFGLGHFFFIIFPKTPPELAVTISNVLLIMAINLWVAFVLAVYRSFLGALDRFDINNFIYLFSIVLRAFGVMYVLKQGFGLEGLALISLLTSFFSLPCLIVAGKKLYPKLKIFSLKINQERLKEVFKFGAGVFVARSGIQLNAYSHQLIIMWVLGPKFLGIFEIAMLLINHGNRLIQATRQVVYPSITKSANLNDYVSLRSIFFWQSKLSFFIGTGMFVGFIVYGEGFINLWLGQTNQDAVNLLSIFSVSMLFLLFSSVTKLVLFGFGRVRINIIFEYSYVVFDVALILLGMELFGKSVEVFALASLFMTAIGRGIIYTCFALKQLEISLISYFVFFGFRVLTCSVLTYWSFNQVYYYFNANNWEVFILSVFTSVSIYLVIAFITLFRFSDFKKIKSRLFNYA